MRRHKQNRATAELQTASSSNRPGHLALIGRLPSAFYEVGAGDGNRTHVASLEDWNSTIELHPQTGSYFSQPERLVNSPVLAPGRLRKINRRSGAGNDLDAVDLGALHVGSECDLELAVGHLHVHGFNVGALGTAGLGPHIEILELMARDTVRKYTLPHSGDSVVGLAKVQFDGVFAVGQFVCKPGHVISFGAINAGVLGVGNLHVGSPLRGLSPVETLIGKPDVAAGISQR